MACRAGIIGDVRRIGLSVASNAIEQCRLGMQLMNAPFARLVSNRFTSCKTGIKVERGCLAQDAAKFGNAVERWGGSILVAHNEFWGCDRPHEAASGRFADVCASWSDDLIDGMPANTDQP